MNITSELREEAEVYHSMELPNSTNPIVERDSPKPVYFSSPDGDLFLFKIVDSIYVNEVETKKLLQNTPRTWRVVMEFVDSEYDHEWDFNSREVAEEFMQALSANYLAASDEVSKMQEQ